MPEARATPEERLRNLRSVTDSSLNQLDLDDLLVELVSRLRDPLDADTAAVLLLDEATETLVARAARGIEEEVHQGVRIPVGTGFAGRIAATRRPVVLTRVDASTVANPLLWDAGIRVMIGVPLLAENRLVGVLHVGRVNDRPFSPADVELLEVAGERVAGAIATRRGADERAAARLLEESLMPQRLPACPGLALAGRYLPAGHRAVGGDWYDAFTLPSGHLWVVVGDVAGHGLSAAVVMGRVRSALRAYALLGESPERVLELTDHKIQHFEFNAMVTVLCAVAPPPFTTFTITTAGHPPPVLATPGGRAELLNPPVDGPLGAGLAGGRRSVPVELGAGGVLVLYSDGLIERRGESLDQGFQRLTAAVAADAPEAVCRRVVRELVGTTAPTDDVSLVVVQRTAGGATPAGGGLLRAEERGG